jgi:hypothetical protein
LGWVGGQGPRGYGIALWALDMAIRGHSELGIVLINDYPLLIFVSFVRWQGIHALGCFKAVMTSNYYSRAERREQGGGSGGWGCGVESTSPQVRCS